MAIRTSANTIRLSDLDALDLGPIKVKLRDPDDGPGWSVERIHATEQLYKEFLYLCVVCDVRQLIVPTKDIDEMWHHHILDTWKYADDCNRFLGGFVHHFPYFGMRGPDDADKLELAFAETICLFKKHFGRNDFVIDSKGGDSPAPCRTSVCYKARSDEGVGFSTQRPSFDEQLPAALDS